MGKRLLQRVNMGESLCFESQEKGHLGFDWKAVVGVVGIVIAKFWLFWAN